MPKQEHAPSPAAYRGDELDLVCRRMLAETMRPCRELPRWQRELDRAAYQERQRVTDEERAAARARRERLGDLFGDDQQLQAV